MYSCMKKKWWSKENICSLTAMLFIFFVTLAFLLRSPVSLWRHSEVGVDTWVFKTVTNKMFHGGMPYLDSFDHKGPLLYILNYLGTLIAYLRGIWVVEFVMDYIAFFFMYKIARLICGRVMSLFCMLCGMSVLFLYFGSGNMVEEYAMTFIAVSLFIYLDYFINDKITIFRLIICGFCFGCVCLLRPNMISLWVVFCIAVLLQSVCSKSWKELLRFVTFFLLGFLVITVPVIVWLAANDALIPCIQQYILFNVEYTSDVTRASFENKWISFFTFCSNTVVIMSILTSVWMCTLREKREKLIGLSYTLYLFVTIFSICMSGQIYGHYGMILVPVVVFPVAKLMNVIKIQNGNPGVGLVVVIYLMAVLIMPDWIEQLKADGSYYANRQETEYSDALKEAVSFIRANSKADETISVYGNYDVLYVLSNRDHATKYSYQFPIGTINTDIMDDYFKELKAELPILIVLTKEKYGGRMKDFLEENNYSLAWSEKTGNDLYNGLTIFKR